MQHLAKEVSKRRTFAIISHPDAGKTTLTEKLLLFGGAIQLAGTIKGRKASRAALSDWMELERQRGISVTTSVLQFEYKDTIFNLLDTPGHEDFSEDTYRTLTAVDSALMVIDAVKGVEPRTIKLMDICRKRNIPIITFINKLDRESRDPIELQDEIEEILNIKSTPYNWPLGSGKSFCGIYDLFLEKVRLYQASSGDKLSESQEHDLNSEHLKNLLGTDLDLVQEQLELAKGAYPEFNVESYLKGELTPVFYGSALRNFGVKELLDAFVTIAPCPRTRTTATREVLATENKFSGFVFKIQANMDAKHHDRIAFLRICSGEYAKGVKVSHLRTGKELRLHNAMTFMAHKRDNAEFAYAGDIIGIPNHGAIKTGDTFTQGEELKFTGIPNFAPDLFKAARPADPLKAKALLKGLTQLSEEGATQIFRPCVSNKIILGTVGPLQFDVVAHRLHYEYKVDCLYDGLNLAAVRWVKIDDAVEAKKFKEAEITNLGYDSHDNLVYLAPSMVNLQMAMERWPEVTFADLSEI